MLTIPLFSQQSIPLEGLLKRYEERLTQAGYCICYRYDMLHWAENFISLHLRNGYDYMNQDTINQFIKKKDEQRYSGEIGQEHYRKWKRIVERFILFAYTGEIGMLPNLNSGPKQELSNGYEKLCEEFLQSLSVQPNTWTDIRWVTRRYFSWLEENGIEKIQKAEVIHAQKFLLQCSQRYSVNTIYDVQLYLKKLYKFLLETGYTHTDLSTLLSFRVSREQKVFPPIPKDDIAKLLESIDRSTKAGKRNYAITRKPIQIRFIFFPL